MCVIAKNVIAALKAKVIKSWPPGASNLRSGFEDAGLTVLSPAD